MRAIVLALVCGLAACGSSGESARDGDVADSAGVDGDAEESDSDSATPDITDTADDSAIDSASDSDSDSATPETGDTGETADPVDTADDEIADGDIATDTTPETDLSPWGLDERPTTACHPFPRPTPAGGAIAYEPAFPNMDFGGRAIGLIRTRLGPAGDMRWFVLDRDGRVWTFVSDQASKDGLAADGVTPVETAEVYLELPETPYGTGGEGGLLGFAFDPDVAVDAAANYLYVHYTLWPTNNVWRFRIGPGAEPGTPWQILESKRIFQTASGGGNHWGGDLAFGPDGDLYLSLGDGGNGMTAADAAKTTWLRGKILRIDPRSAGPDEPYRIPADNPWSGGPLCTGRDLADNTVDCPEIFARGFRNPWRMTFDRATQRLWVGDVGAGKEEVDLVLAGGDHGWNRCDGRNPRASCPPDAADSPLIAPVAQYRHYGSASIVMGYVYHGQALGPAFQGALLFTDAYNGELFALPAPYANVSFAPFRVTQVLEHPDEGGEADLPRFSKVDAPILSFPVSFAEDEHAEPYVVTFGSGRGRGVWRLALATPEPVEDPVPATLSATGCFDVVGERPAPGMIPYDLNAPFWSDGAEKSRAIALPPSGEPIEVTADGDWVFPIGTVIVKHFRRHDRPIETRLFMRHDDGGWAGYSYAWREDRSDADRTDLAGELRVFDDDPWSYPSRAGCMTCHSAEAGYTLGPETRQLDRLHDYDGRLANQVATFAHIGAFASEVAPDPAAAFPNPFDPTVDLAVRARVYLHANCAQCHRGARFPDLRFDAPPPCTHITAGQANASKIIQRMTAGDPTARMPRGGGLVIDYDGVDLLRSWINNLATCP